MLFGVFALAQPAAGVAVFLPGEVPDWDQPYNYPTGSPGSTGPGPRVPPFTYDAWCVPTAAANLLGHWEDALGQSVADGAAFPNEGSASYGVSPDWHDHQADANRPSPAPSSPALTDLGWYMDTNNLGDTSLANPPHTGTYLKDTHVGVASLLTQLGRSFSTGTRGTTFAAGLAADGSPATVHPGVTSAFAEIRSEIDAGRSVIVTFHHWNVSAAPGAIPIAADPARTDEGRHGATYYDIGGFTGTDPWGNQEEWSDPETGPESQTLGHTVTAVGYILANDIHDPGYPFPPQTGLPSNWIIVHDNVGATPRNVIVPFNATTFSAWVANSNVGIAPIAVPSVGPAGLLALAVLLVTVGLAGLAVRRRWRLN